MFLGQRQGEAVQQGLCGPRPFRRGPGRVHVLRDHQHPLAVGAEQREDPPKGRHGGATGGVHAVRGAVRAGEAGSLSGQPDERVRPGGAGLTGVRRAVAPLHRDTAAGEPSGEGQRQGGVGVPGQPYRPGPLRGREGRVLPDRSVQYGPGAGVSAGAGLGPVVGGLRAGGEARAGRGVRRPGTGAEALGPVGAAYRPEAFALEGVRRNRHAGPAGVQRRPVQPDPPRPQPAHRLQQVPGSGIGARFRPLHGRQHRDVRGRPASGGDGTDGAGERTARAEVDEGVVPLVQQPCDGGAEQDRPDGVPPPVTGRQLRLPPAGDGAQQRHGRGAGRHRLGGALQGIQGRFQQRGMEGVGHAEPARGDAACGEVGDGLVHGGRRACQDHVAGPVDGGHAQPATRCGHQPGDLLLTGPDRGHGTREGELAHETSPFGGESHRVRQGQRLRDTGGGDLADTVPDHGVGRDSPRGQLPRQADAVCDQQGLRHLCPDRPSSAGSRIQAPCGEGASEDRPEDGGRLVHHLTEHRSRAVQPADHAVLPSPLPGQQERQPRTGTCLRPVRPGDAAPGGERFEAFREVALRDEREPVRPVVPCRPDRGAHVPFVQVRTRPQVRGELTGRRTQRRRGTGRQRQEVLTARAGSGAVPGRRRGPGAAQGGPGRGFLQDRVGVRPAEAEGVDPGDERSGRAPLLVPVDQREAGCGTLQVRGRRSGLRSRRQLPVPQRQYDLEEGGHPGRVEQVSHVGLHRAEPARQPVGPRWKGLPEGTGFHRVADRGAGAVRFDVRHGRRVDAGLGVGAGDHLALRAWVRREQAQRPAVVVDRRGAYEGEDGVVGATGVAEPAEHEGAAAFAGDEAVGVCTEGPAPSGR